MGAKSISADCLKLSCFNPRTRDGCEQPSAKTIAETGVSIHAPVMGAKLVNVPAKDALSFNPRTRDGCELIVDGLTVETTVSIHAPVMGANKRNGRYSRELKFQSTHP